MAAPFRKWVDDLPLDLRERVESCLAIGSEIRQLRAAWEISASAKVKAVEALSQEQRRVHLSEVGGALEVLRKAIRDQQGGCISELSTLKEKLQLYEAWVKQSALDLEAAAANEVEFAPIKEKVDSFLALVDATSALLERTGRRLAWQVTYASEADPFDSHAAVNFRGGKITDKEGRDVWADLCAACGCAIQEGLRGQGVARHRCLECPFVVLCSLCFSVQKTLAGAALRASRPWDLFTDPKYLHATHMTVEEQDHPVFMRLSVWESKTLPTLVYRASVVYAQRPLFGRHEGDAFEWVSYRETWVRAHGLACGLRSLLPAGAFVGISSKNRIEWALADLACVLNDFTSVGIMQTLTDAECEALFKKAELCALVCSTEFGRRVVTAGLPQRCPSLRWLVLMDQDATISSSSDCTVVSGFGNLPKSHAIPYCGLPAAPTTEDLDRLDAKHEVRRQRIFTLIFTSGSTGAPKGAIISERAWIADINDPDFASPLVSCSWMPAALGADRSMWWRVMLDGGRIGYASSAPPFEDLPLLEPTCFFAPPAVWITLYQEFQRQIEGQQDREAVLQRFRAMLGRRVSWIGTGSAATPPAVMAWMRDCWKIAVLEAYGTTEVGGITSNSTRNPHAEVKLLDVPEMGYFSTDKPYPRGELCVRSNITIPGYYKDEVETQRNLQDGWFLTGDIVELHGPSEIKVIDRKSNIFKLSTGEFVSPVKLESIYNESPLVSQICIVGNGSHSFVLAIVVPSVRLQAPDRDASLLREFSELASRNQLRKADVPRGVLIDDLGWTPENGLLTPSLKVARIKIREKYKDQLVALFRALENESAPAQAEIPQTVNSGSPSFAAIAAAVLGKPVDATKSFVENGGDSLTLVAFLLRLRSALKSDHLSLQYVASSPLSRLDADLAAHGEGAQKSWATAEFDRVEAMVKSDLALSLPALDRSDVTLTAPAEDILLTGATGFLGAQLLHDLLESRKCTVWCLVRANSPSEAESRVRSAMQQADLWDSKYAGCLKCVPGRLEAPLLGLSDDDHREMVQRVGAVYHSAADVSFTKTYDQLRAVNVVGTMEILRFSLSSSPPKELHYIGTLSVWGDAANSWAITEDMELGTDTHAMVRSCLDGYARTKWVAEALLRRARLELSAPVWSYRCGFISWHSRTGHSNPADWLTRWLSAAAALGAYPDVVSVLNLSPVDYVSSAILHLSARPLPSRAPYCNIFSPHPLPARSLFVWLAGTGVTLRSVSGDQFLDLLRNKGGSFVSLLPFFEGGYPVEGKFSSQSYRLLAAAGVICSQITAASLSIHAGYLRRAGLIPTSP